MFWCLLTTFGGLTVLLSFVDFQGWSGVLLVPSQKGEKIGARRLVFAFILLGLRTIKRGTPWMVWVNSTFAQNHMHPLAILIEQWWRGLHNLVVAVISRLETPVWRCGLSTDTLPASKVWLTSRAEIRPETFVSCQRFWFDLPTAGDSGLPGLETPVPNFVASQSSAGVQARCHPGVRPETLISSRRLQCGYDLGRRLRPLQAKNSGPSRPAMARICGAL
jgi:hypothetical protein